MNTQNCLEAAMFAASENYSVASYEVDECVDAERLLIDEELWYPVLQGAALQARVAG